MKKISKYTPTYIADWHIKALNWVTCWEQLKKLELEMREVRAEEGKSREKYIAEWADVWIVACVLVYRFYMRTGEVFMDYIRSLPEYVEIMKAVDEKMEININRKWYKDITGETRHVEDDKTEADGCPSADFKAESFGEGDNRQGQGKKTGLKVL